MWLSCGVFDLKLGGPGFEQRWIHWECPWARHFRAPAWYRWNPERHKRCELSKWYDKYCWKRGKTPFNQSVNQSMKNICGNIQGKGESADNQHFLLFPKYFQSSSFELHLFCHLECFQLVWSKILSYCKDFRSKFFLCKWNSVFTDGKSLAIYSWLAFNAESIWRPREPLSGVILHFYRNSWV